MLAKDKTRVTAAKMRFIRRTVKHTRTGYRRNERTLNKITENRTHMRENV